MFPLQLEIPSADVLHLIHAQVGLGGDLRVRREPRELFYGLVTVVPGDKDGQLLLVGDLFHSQYKL